MKSKLISTNEQHTNDDIRLAALIQELEHSMTVTETLSSEFLARCRKIELHRNGAALTAWIKHQDGTYELRYIPAH